MLDDFPFFLRRRHGQPEPGGLAVARLIHSESPYAYRAWPRLLSLPGHPARDLPPRPGTRTVTSPDALSPYLKPD